MAANLANVRELLGDYSQQTKLIAVSKNASIEQITEACNLGVHDFAESRIQDALSKKSQMAPQIALQTNWHFIGHLQSNKVKQAVGNFSLIHSVDTLKLAQEISSGGGARIFRLIHNFYDFVLGGFVQLSISWLDTLFPDLAF